LVLACVLLVGAWAGCAGEQAGPPVGEEPTNTTDEEPDTTAPRTTIAWDRVPAPETVPSPDPARLGELVDRQVYTNGTEPRYRTPGTASHEATIPDLVAMLEEAGADVETNTFPVEIDGIGEVNATNVYGVREGNDTQIWLAAHWDSRAWADQAKNESRREEPVLGANDGAAAVAVVTHALEILPATNATVNIALFDVEDQGQGAGGYIKGSTHAAEQMTEDELAAIDAFLLVDMPGHDPLSIKREGYSHGESSTVTDLTFGVAERLEAASFRNESGPPITDDHVPFVQREVPAIDLIHLDDNGTTPFPWTWHTPHDTPEHVSNASMAEVTQVVAGTAMAVDRGALPPTE
jgi:hypothetical protein